MIRHKLLFLVLILVIFVVGCSSAHTQNTYDIETKYYVVENGKKTYFENYKIIESIPDFDSILKSTVKSLNEIKDGKRELGFINEIASDELKKDEVHKAFLNSIQGESETKTISADIDNYAITGLQYDKDLSFIKVFIEIEINEKQKDRLITVLNNQTYIFKIENNKLLLTKYDLSQFI